jgi:hypothetical protein
MIQEWRHLKMLKRSGRGHDPSGIAATKRGELAVLCPACPQPNKNLPVGWEDVRPDRRCFHFRSLCWVCVLTCFRWLYALFIAIDANFRLTRKAVSNDKTDPGLGSGWAYFVEEKPYKDHLATFVNVPQEVRMLQLLVNYMTHLMPIEEYLLKP